MALGSRPAQQPAPMQLGNSLLGAGDGGLPRAGPPRQMFADDTSQCVVTDQRVGLYPLVQVADELSREYFPAENQRLVHSGELAWRGIKSLGLMIYV